MDKKGVELSMNVIIIAVIALLVLVVLIFIFSGRTQIFAKGTEACSTKQGTCIDSAEACPGPVVSALDCSEGQKCCVRVA